MDIELGHDIGPVLFNIFNADIQQIGNGARFIYPKHTCSFNEFVILVRWRYFKRVIELVVSEGL